MFFPWNAGILSCMLPKLWSKPSWSSKFLYWLKSLFGRTLPPNSLPSHVSYKRFWYVQNFLPWLTTSSFSSTLEFSAIFSSEEESAHQVDLLTSFPLPLGISCLLIISILILSIFPIKASIITSNLSCLSTRSFTFNCVILFLWHCEYLHQRLVAKKDFPTHSLTYLHSV